MKFAQKTFLAKDKQWKIKNSDEYKNNLRKFMAAGRKKCKIILGC